MKKLLFSFILMLMSIAAQAQQWYYIPSGDSPKGPSYGKPVYIIIKDTSGELWVTTEQKHQFKKFVAQNINWYVEEFNSSYRDQYSAEDVRTSKHYKHFRKHSIKEKTSKCIILFGAILGGDALSLDYKTLVLDPDKENPCYYSSVPIEQFVVRRNVDDLF